MLTLGLAPGLARADEAIAGQWQADMGQGVAIVMDVIADGNWFSTTVQDGKVVAELAGTYTQAKKNDATGHLVFTPLKAFTKGEHGPAVVEDDEYTLSKNGAVLTLVSVKDTMEFHKQAFAK
jgi:Tfp pilus assembly protein PilV